MTSDRIAFVGFGEAAMAFRTGWGANAPAGLRAFDIKTLAAASNRAMKDRYAAYGVAGAESLAEALKGATVVFSLVTADQALVAARQAEEVLPKGLVWLDCNSCSPDTKRAAAEAIEGAGAPMSMWR